MYESNGCRMQRDWAFPHSISAPNNFKQEQQNQTYGLESAPQKYTDYSKVLD